MPTAQAIAVVTLHSSLSEYSPDGMPAAIDWSAFREEVATARNPETQRPVFNEAGLDEFVRWCKEFVRMSDASSTA